MKLNSCFFNCRHKTCDSQTLTWTRTLKGGGFGLTHTHPFFGCTNKSVILAMEKSIKVGANKAKRKVDYFTDEDERRILAHPLHQPNCAYGVQRRFVLFATFVFFMRGNTKL